MRTGGAASRIRCVRRGLSGARPWTALVLVAAWLGTAAATLGADPTASPAGGDVRTTPAAPGVVGDPLLAVLAVVLVGAVAVGITLAAAGLTSRR